MRLSTIAGFVTVFGVGSLVAQGAWGFRFEVSPNGVSWGPSIGANPGGTVYFRVSAYFDVGTQVVTGSGTGNAVVFSRFTGQQKLAGTTSFDSVTDMVRLVPNGGVQLLSVSISQSGHLIGTTAATSFASFIPTDLAPFIAQPQTFMPILKGKLTLGADSTPRVITVMNNLFGSGGMRYYSDIALTPMESGNPVDHPNHTDFTATIQVPNGGCSAPTIQSVSGGGVVAPSQIASFSVSATDAVFFEWLKNGTTLSEGGRISGTGSTTLNIANPALTDAGSYRVRVYNACGTPKLSDAVTLSVICGGDLNRDGLVDDADFVAFAQSYEQLVCPAAPATCPADLNLDGFVDDTDFVVFATQYDQLLCP